MDKRIQVILVLGIIITIVSAFLDMYLAGIVGVIFIAIIMSLMIMQDTTGISGSRGKAQRRSKKYYPDKYRKRTGRKDPRYPDTR